MEKSRAPDRRVPDNGAGRDSARRAVLVAGMHRSGTSALSHALALRGLQLPRTPMPPSPGNPLGHWGESEPIRWLHEDLLGEAGTSWEDPLPFPPGWTTSPAGEAWTHRMAAAVADEFPGDSPFLLKDPRVSRLIPFWLSVFAELNVTPGFVIPIRNPLEVAGSLKARDGFDQARGLLLWLRYNLEAERDTRDQPRAFVAYGQLLRDWRSSLSYISERIGLAWAQSGWTSDVEIERALASGARHHDVADTELNARTDVVDWVKRAYGALLDACEADSEPDRRVLDAVAEALGQADLVYAPLVAGERSDAGERLAADLQELEDRLTAREAAWATERREHEGEVRALRAAVDEHSARTARLQAEQDEARRREQELRRKLDELESRGLFKRIWAAPAKRRQRAEQRRRTASQLGSWVLRPPSLRGVRMLREFIALRNSPHFDRAYYLTRNSDVATAGMNPVAHYIEHGAAAGLDPSPSFSTRDYLKRHPELAKRGINPLWHFQRTGGRDRAQTAGDRPDDSDEADAGPPSDFWVAPASPTPATVEQTPPGRATAPESGDRKPSPWSAAGEPVEIWFDTRISPHDSMARPDRLDHYFLVGTEALRLIENALAANGGRDPAVILDLPCGYGRVLRMLRAAFPEAAITACDLDRGGVEFCERTFGVEGALSERDLDELSLNRTYDLVWCGSLLTHLPEGNARAALRALARHLAPHGLLMFTTHGDAIRRLIADHIASGSVDDDGKPELLRAYGRLEEPAGSELLHAYDEKGFGFAPYPDSQDASYGFALSSQGWVEARLADVPGLVHLSSQRAAWHGRQDVYVCQGARD